MAAYKGGELIKESDWMRVYRIDAQTTMYESKFLVDGLTVSVEAIKRRWPDLSPAERLEFAQAFQSKPEITSGDELIMDFLMEAGDLPIWVTIAPQLVRHSDRKRTLAFLLQRVNEVGTSRANFYQSIERMNEGAAVPVLRRLYEEYRSRVEEGVAHSKSEYMDYLSCCRALWKIDGSPEYKEAIDTAARTGDGALRSWVGEPPSEH